MGVSVTILIDGESVPWSAERPTALVVREDQEIGVKLALSELERAANPEVYVEDFYLTLSEEIVEVDGDVLIYIAPPSRIFRDAFGAALVRVIVGEYNYCIPFDVLAKKIHAVQAEDMILYLIAKSEDIVRVCLSRTLRPVGSQGRGFADPEMVLSAAESFVASVLSVRVELKHQLRKRLLPLKQPSWKALRGESGIDPYDVLSNLDALEPAGFDCDAIISGRGFSTSGIDITTLESIADVEENTTLLGGLYSMRRVLQSLYTEIEKTFDDRPLATYDKEYITLNELLLKVTASGMGQRCARQIETIEELIRYFEQTLKIPFRGEVRPRITPHVRASRLYRGLFEQLWHWYSIGAPSIEGTMFVVKLRSLAKIFEYFTLFKLFDYFNSTGWTLLDARLDPELDRLIPTSLSFQKDVIRLTLEYEPRVFPLRNSSVHLDLIDLKHSNASGVAWWPDFVLRIEVGEDANYYILDAKYSTASIVKNRHLPSLFDKYFVEMAVFDARKGLLDHGRILGVLAVFPGQDDTIAPTPWRSARYGLGASRAIRLPIVAGIPLSSKCDMVMTASLDKIIDIARQRLTH